MKTVLSPLSERKKIYSSSGNKYRFEYIRVDDPDGRVWLKEVGKVDIQDEINSNKPVAVSALINKYMRGDLSALGDSSRAFYGDVSGVGDLHAIVDLAQTVEFMPGNLTEAAEASIPESEVKDNA